MKKFLVFCTCLVMLTGCKKAIEKIQENLLVQAMVDGQWRITNFELDAANITDQFIGYTFQYYESRSVDAFKNGNLEKTGTWDGDVSTQTTWANFPNVTEPLIMVNGTWHIVSSSWTYVVASQTVNGVTRIMRLDKI
jgi:hypothetical protein